VLLIGGIGSFFLPPMHPQETETHGWLVPANDPMPKNECSRLSPLPAGSLLLAIAGGGAYITTRTTKFLVIKLGDCRLLWMQRGPQGLLIDADIFNPSGDLIARIRDNEFQLAFGQYSYVERTDASTLIVYDRGGKELLWLRYSNPNVVQLRGVFSCPNSLPITIENDRIVLPDGTQSKNCGRIAPDYQGPFLEYQYHLLNQP
jgi:hypothetical protein